MLSLEVWPSCLKVVPLVVCLLVWCRGRNGVRLGVGTIGDRLCLFYRHCMRLNNLTPQFQLNCTLHWRLLQWMSSIFPHFGLFFLLDICRMNFILEPALSYVFRFSLKLVCQFRAIFYCDFDLGADNLDTAVHWTVFAVRKGAKGDPLGCWQPRQACGFCFVSNCKTVLPPRALFPTSSQALKLR